MSRDTSRRVFLTATGAVLGGGLAGCGQAPETETTPSGDTTYGFEIENTIEAAAFERSDQFTSPRPAVIHVRVTDQDPNSGTVFFERTVEVATNSTKTIPDAFTAEEGGPIMAINVRLEPFVEGGLSRDHNRQNGFSFQQGQFNTPVETTIPVVLNNYDDAEGTGQLYPNIYLAPELSR